MQTAQKLRPVAKYERDWGNVLVLPPTYDNLEVGVRVRTMYCGGVSSVFGRLKGMVKEDRPDYDFRFAAVLYDAGCISRHPQRGHGYVLLYGDRIEIPQTNWSESDKSPHVLDGKPVVLPLEAATIKKLLKNIEEGASLAVRALTYYRCQLADPHEFRF